MSKRREVQDRIDAIQEIADIMGSMKNLALMETRKLSQYHTTQQKVVNSIEAALTDVQNHYASESEPVPELPVYLVLGSERGFCGAYNEQLINLLAQQNNALQAVIIGVGNRLAESLQQQYPDSQLLSGASIADEVAPVLLSIAETLSQLRQTHGQLQLSAIHFIPDNPKPICQAVWPIPKADTLPLPPLINLPPQQLLSELVEHYLFAVMHTWFYAALVAENQQRIQHLDQAEHHLSHQLEDLEKRRNVLRQEEIIEEIEVILLSAELAGKPGGSEVS